GAAGGKPDGEPIKDYFPRVVSDDLWEQARKATRDRARRPGRPSPIVNVFQGLTRCARDGAAFMLGKQSSTRGSTYRVVVCNAPRIGAGSGDSIPLATFEPAVLSMLREIDPHAILNGDSGPDESLVLAGDLAAVDARIAELEAELLAGDVAALARALRAL